MKKSKKIIIVSNRLPISVKKNGDKLAFHNSIGGLATGLSGYIKNKDNKWVGWPGIASDLLTSEQKLEITEKLLKCNCYPIFLTKAQLDGFYNGYSNSILWPLLHNKKNISLTASQQKHFWNVYKQVNVIYAKTILGLCENGNNIWIHDYHLFLLPSMLRKLHYKGKIGFFLHIPFPTAKQFAKIKNAKELILGVLGADLIGCHINRYKSNFIESCKRFKIGSIDGDYININNRTVRIKNFPMSIDYDKFVRSRNIGIVKNELARLQDKYKGNKIILAVDRLDPTKGLAGRVKAYRKLLLKNSHLHGDVVMLILAVPSRVELEDYIKTRIELEKLISRTNNVFQTDSWKPIEYIYGYASFEELISLYQLAEIAYITPLVDGMNLVAKEYVVSKTDNNGVLILSETAGAAEELKEAIIVDPSNKDSMLNSLVDALSMDEFERGRRLDSMRQHLSSHTVKDWSDDFMSFLQKS